MCVCVCVCVCVYVCVCVSSSEDETSLAVLFTLQLLKKKQKKQQPVRCVKYIMLCPEAFVTLSLAEMTNCMTTDQQLCYENEITPLGVEKNKEERKNDDQSDSLANGQFS